MFDGSARSPEVSSGSKGDNGPTFPAFSWPPTQCNLNRALGLHSERKWTPETNSATQGAGLCICGWVCGCVLDCWEKTSWDKAAITVYVYVSCYMLWMAHLAVVLFLPNRGKSNWHDLSLGRQAITRWMWRYWNDLFSPCTHFWIGKGLNCETGKEGKMNKTKHTESPRPFSKAGAYTFALQKVE